MAPVIFERITQLWLGVYFCHLFMKQFFYSGLSIRIIRSPSSEHSSRMSDPRHRWLVIECILNEQIIFIVFLMYCSCFCDILCDPGLACVGASRCSLLAKPYERLFHVLGGGGPPQQQEGQVRQYQEVPLCGLPNSQSVRAVPYPRPTSGTHDRGYQNRPADGLQDGRRAVELGNPCKSFNHL